MDKNRFPHFTSGDGGMIASEMQERLDAIAPDYHRLNPTTQARLLLEEIARKEAENARLREALRYIVRTYNNGAMTDARIASSMCQAARSALDVSSVA